MKLPDPVKNGEGQKGEGETICAGKGCGLDWTPAPVCDAQGRYVACGTI